MNDPSIVLATCSTAFGIFASLMWRRAAALQRRQAQLQEAFDRITIDEMFKLRATVAETEQRLHNLRSNALLADFNGWHQYYWNCKPEVRERAERKGYVRV